MNYLELNDLVGISDGGTSHPKWPTKRRLPYLELFHESGDGGRGVDEDDAEAAGRVHGGEAGEDVGAGAVPETDHHLHAKVVQHVHQVLADLQGM